MTLCHDISCLCEMVGIARIDEALLDVYADNSWKLENSLMELEDLEDESFMKLANLEALDLNASLREIESILKTSEELELISTEKNQEPTVTFPEEEPKVNSTVVSHIITENTTSEELNAIQQAASEAGINVRKELKIKR